MTPRLTRHVGLLLGLLVVPVTAGMAQVPDTARSGRLAAVRSLKIGRPIRVTQASGPRVAGVLAAPADTMVTLEWSGGLAPRVGRWWAPESALRFPGGNEYFRELMGSRPGLPKGFETVRDGMVVATL